jgi:hypothetical protein
MTRFSRMGWVALALAMGAYTVFVAAQERVGQPAISSITPAGHMQDAPQTLTIAGRNFAERLTLEVTSPEGQMQVLSGQDIRDLRDSTFQVSLLINRPGVWAFLVRNTDGTASNVFQYRVPPASATPAIERVDPSSVSRDARPQRFTVVGRNFEYGLTVTVTDPAGEVTTIASSDLGTVTATSFTIDLTLSMAGDYSLLVNDPAAGTSNSVTITASVPVR